MGTLRQRLLRLGVTNESGFTLIELVVVVTIIGILLAITVTSFLGFRGRAGDAAAKSNIKAAVPSAEAYFADHDDYSGLSVVAIRTSYDSGVDAGLIVKPGAASYCLAEIGQTGTTWYFAGPRGSLTSTKPAGC
jgi:prepilin-type N-terminal cleavage/methylation domain-containing protein